MPSPIKAHDLKSPIREQPSPLSFLVCLVPSRSRRAILVVAEGAAFGGDYDSGQAQDLAIGVRFLPFTPPSTLSYA
ncbi:hypothetical protein BHE74_00049359 [Ensete ventricosum]|nr:hypothetical protein BHE74_00049359 [Ensete ventricosum]